MGTQWGLALYSVNLPLLFRIVLLTALAHIGLGNPLHGSHIGMGASPFTCQLTPDAQVCALVPLVFEKKNIYFGRVNYSNLSEWIQSKMKVSQCEVISSESLFSKNNTKWKSLNNTQKHYKKIKQMF